RRHSSPLARPQAYPPRIQITSVYSNQGQIKLGEPRHQQRAPGYPAAFDTFDNILALAPGSLLRVSSSMLWFNALQTHMKPGTLSILLGELPSTPTTLTFPELGRIASNWLPLLLLQNLPSPLHQCSRSYPWTPKAKTPPVTTSTPSTTVSMSPSSPLHPGRPPPPRPFTLASHVSSAVASRASSLGFCLAARLSTKPHQ
ncbi:hypothetical protein C8R45DRAFT_1139240, partial [Mycena sanguinolenta]